MKRRLAPLILAVPLLLAGCGGGSEEFTPESTPQSSSVTSSPATTESTTAELGDLTEGVEGQVGFRHGIDCATVDECSLNFTVESLDVLDQCDDYVMTHSGDRPEGTHLVKATVLVETTDRGTDYPAGEFPVWADWSALTEDGANVPLDSSSWCYNNNSQQWKEQLRLGDTERRVHYMDVPDGTTKIRLTETLNGARWEFPAPNAETLQEPAAQHEVTPAPDSPAPAPQTQAHATPAAPPVSAQQSPVAPPVIGMTEAPGHAQPSAMNKTVQSCGDVTMHQPGTTFFTDGTSGWTQQCSDQMMPAAQALLQE